jgi:sugar lactone lactonase YvrE
VLPGRRARRLPGGGATCPYVAVTQIGQRAEGVMRFPQALAIGPDGSVFVADQGSHVVQVFGPDGVFLREFGIAGSKPGSSAASGAIAVAGDGSVLVADGANRIDRFDANGQLMNSWGRTGSDVGRFRFGAGAGNSAAAGGGLAVSGDFVYVADTGNDRIQRFTLDGGHGAEIVRRARWPTRAGSPCARPGCTWPTTSTTGSSSSTPAGTCCARWARTARGPASSTSPTAWPPTPRGACSSPTTSTPRRALQQRAVYPYKGRWGSYGTAPGPARLPARDRGRRRGQRVRGQHRQRPHRRLRQGRRAAALVRRLRARGGAVRRAGRRRLGPRWHPGGDRLDQRPRAAAQPDGTLASSWGSPAPGPTILPDPVAVAFDAGGNAYVLDRRRSRIVPSRATGTAVRTIGSPGSGPGQLLNPSALTIDGGGTIVVADSGNERIARFGTGGSYLGATTGVGDGRGHRGERRRQRTYLSTANHRIEVYDPSGSEVDEFGGPGQQARQARVARADRPRRRRQPVGGRPRQQPHPGVRARRRAPRSLRRARRPASASSSTRRA